MYVFTFYSFKGGVGRTMALVNVAAELVRRGRKVLVVDFDLEAPGLETYKHLSPEKPHPGIVEYVTEFRKNYEVPNLRDYIYETKPIGKKGGRLWVMPAGRRDRAYRSALANLDWPRLYKEESGFLLFEDTKLGWEQELNPDYVLIDSRTGDTDVLGICTRQLPNSVVLMFTPNEQNLAGLENVCRDIRREETEGLEKKIKLHFVAANVPDLDDERGILRRQIKTFCERLEFVKPSEIVRRHENLNLLDQSIFTLDRPRTRLARSYRRLLRRLLKDNLADREAAMIFLEDFSKHTNPPLDERRHWAQWGRDYLYEKDGEIVMFEGDTKRAHQTFHEKRLLKEAVLRSEERNRIAEVAIHFNNDVEVLQSVAESLLLIEDYRRAVEALNRILQLEPDRARAAFQRALCRINLFDVDGAADDLLAYLRLIGLGRGLPPGQAMAPLLQFQQGCLEKLSAMAPAKLEKLAEMVQSNEIQQLDLEVVSSYLCRKEEGVPIAARLLRNQVAGLDKQKGISRDLQWALLRARCWGDIIELYEAGRLKEKGAWSILCVALAHWGENGEMPEALCRQALESDDQFPRSWSLDAESWLLWRVGRAADAVRLIENIQQKAPRAFGLPDVFSLWRLRPVPVGDYFDDCKLLRRMFQGELLRPAFLGPSPARTQTSHQLQGEKNMKRKPTSFHEMIERIVKLLNGIVEQTKLLAGREKKASAPKERAEKLTTNAKDLSESLSLACQSQNALAAAEALRKSRSRWIQSMEVPHGTNARLECAMNNLKSLAHAALETYDENAAYIVEERDGAVTLEQLTLCSASAHPNLAE